MKIKINIIALFLMLFCNAIAEIHDTNAKLPDKGKIPPFAKVKVGLKTVQVTATFLNQKKVFSYNQGNFRKIVYLVTYKLKNKDKRFPMGTITFLAKDGVPAVGSGIKVGKLAWPFAEGMMTFLLEPDVRVTFRKFYHIASYKKFNNKDSDKLATVLKSKTESNEKPKIETKIRPR